MSTPMQIRGHAAGQCGWRTLGLYGEHSQLDPSSPQDASIPSKSLGNVQFGLTTWRSAGWKRAQLGGRTFPEPGWTAYPPVCCGLHTASCSQCSCRQRFGKVTILLHMLPEQSRIFESHMTSNLVEKLPFLHQRMYLTYADYRHIPNKVCMEPGK